jgi:hypothetical protein
MAANGAIITQFLLNRLLTELLQRFGRKPLRGELCRGRETQEMHVQGA